MEAWRYNFYGRLGIWLDKRSKRAAAEGNLGRALRLIDLMRAADAKIEREGCPEIGISAYHGISWLR